MAKLSNVFLAKSCLTHAYKINRKKNLSAGLLGKSRMTPEKNRTEQNRTELFIWLFQPGDYALRLYFSRYHASHHIIHDNSIQ